MRLFVTLAIFEGCPSTWLDSEPALRAALLRAVEEGGFTCKEIVVVPFSPQGVTACAVVSESHLALHSWPEEGRLFLDVASCGSQEGVRRAVEAIRASMPEGRLAVLDERIVDPTGARPA